MKKLLIIPIVLSIFSLFFWNKEKPKIEQPTQRPTQQLAGSLVYPQYGGTGTSTIPHLGDIMIGGLGDKWARIASSSAYSLLTVSSTAPYGIGWSTQIGASGTRLNAFLNNLDATTLTIGGTASGDLNMGNNNILNANYVKANYFNATSTTATSTFSGGLTVGGNVLWVSNGGNVGIASSTPSAQLAVQGNIIGSGNIVLYGTATSTLGKIETTAFKLTTGPASNYVLTSDANGYATWQNPDTINPENWQFIGVNALRPTSTIGIIVSASSTINTLDISGGTVTGMNIYPSFSYSTTSWSGTTTVALGPAWVAETWLSAQCFTNAGNISVVFNDGANNMDLIHASTTIGIVNFTANNSFTASEKRYVTMGSPESSAQSLSCTIKKRF